MLSKKIEEELNQRINDELYSWYLYMAMAAFFESKNFPGFTNWMKLQADEEMIHAMKNYHYVLERGGTIQFKKIDSVSGKWNNVLEVFEEAYAHEQKVSALYNDFMNSAVEEKDHASQSYIQWFINEQVEEEAAASAVVERLKMAKDSPGGLFMIDQEMGKRQPTTATATN